MLLTKIISNSNFSLTAMTIFSGLSRKAEALRKRLGLSYDQILGIRFAVNVGISTAIVWSVLQIAGNASPLLAIASMVATSDPQPIEARKMFRARLINSLVGCTVGLLILFIGGVKEWLLSIGLAVTVLISFLVVRVRAMWLQAPITAALVIGTGIVHGSASKGIADGLHRVAEIFFASLVGVSVSWIMSKIWLIRKDID
jgi:uncharacterized membrane protein YccC